jgi:hypothetical protein
MHFASNVAAPPLADRSFVSWEPENALWGLFFLQKEHLIL